jgi:membrane protease YdiL (CAAX protease family)
MGPNGIRAGWRVLIFILIAATCGAALRRLATLMLHKLPTGFGPGPIILGDGIGFLSLLLSAAMMAKIERRSLSDYALPVRGTLGARFGLGACWGFSAVTALLLLLRVLHAFSFGTLALGGADLVTWAAVWAVAALCVGFFEEFLFRGYALYTLTTGIGFWPAAVMLSGLFGIAHLGNPGWTWVDSLSDGLAGLFFCLTLRRTGSLWFAIGFHSTFDYSEAFLYSVSNHTPFQAAGHLLNSSFHGSRWLTGGPASPESSLLGFVMLAALFVAFNRLYPAAQFPVSRPATPEQGPTKH